MREQEDEGGFTLVELLVSITVLGVILSAIVSAMLVYLSNGVDSSRRDDHSAGAALLASYLERDLASADAVTTGGTACSGTANRLSLTWTQWSSSVSSPVPAPSGGTWTAAYALVPSPGDPSHWLLRRWLCGTGAGSTDLLDALTSSTALTATVGADPECPGGVVAVTLPGYTGDVGAGHPVTGCIGARTP